MEFSYGIGRLSKLRGRVSPRFLVLNPPHSVILKDSYLPLIRFDLYSVGKARQRGPEWEGRKVIKTQRGGSR